MRVKLYGNEKIGSKQRFAMAGRIGEVKYAKLNGAWMARATSYANETRVFVGI